MQRDIFGGTKVHDTYVRRYGESVPFLGALLEKMWKEGSSDSGPRVTSKGSLGRYLGRCGKLRKEWWMEAKENFAR